MFRSFHALFATLAVALTAAAAEELSPQLIAAREGIRGMIEEGKIEHARRAISRNLAVLPNDPVFRAMQIAVEEIYRREWGAHAKGSQAPATTARPLPPPAAAETPTAGEPYTLRDLELTLLWIPPGTFVMANVHGSDDETPVTLSHGFWLGRTEVTQEQWRMLRPDYQNASLFKGSSRPVDSVPWVDALEFARQLNMRERAAGRLPDGYEYTLPSEAQWEYACRAGTTGPFAGNIDSLGWYERNSGAQTHLVAQLAPNAWGLYDMHGNVWEWCYDGLEPYGARPVVDPVRGLNGAGTSAWHIIRGGGWNSAAGQCRSDLRYWRPLSTVAPGIGFRIALVPIRAPARAEAP